MTDILREIDEELERERMLALWAKYKRLVLTLALGLVIGTASYSAWKEHSQTTNIKRSGALYDIMARSGQSDHDKLEALQGLIREFPGSGQATLAQFISADLQARSKQLPQAITTLEKLAQDATVADVLRQYAGLMAIQYQLDSGDAATLQKKLAAFTAPEQPWRYTALALQGLVLAKSGAAAKAQETFAALAQDHDTPPTLRDYAHDLAAYYATQAQP